MFRLFKILLAAALLAGLYFYLQHTPLITTTWPRVQPDQNISLAFPYEPRHHTRTVNSKLFGTAQLDVYDFIDNKEAYICLRIEPQHETALQKNLAQLLDEIRHLNDTDSAQITLKKQFIYHGYPAYEYQARTDDKALLVRLLKVDGAVYSLIYAVKEQELNERQAENFFNSLQF